MTSIIPILLLLILAVNFMYISRILKKRRNDIEDIDTHGDIHGGEILKIEFRYCDRKREYCNIHALVKCEDNIEREIRVNGLRTSEIPNVRDKIIFKIHADSNKKIKNSGAMSDFFESFVDKKPHSKNIKTALFVEQFYGDDTTEE